MARFIAELYDLKTGVILVTSPEFNCDREIVSKDANRISVPVQDDVACRVTRVSTEDEQS